MSSDANIYVAIVDDDESIGRSLSRFLRAAHLQPIVYSSADAFLSDTKRPRFDCLVLDVQLQGMSGLELNERLAAVRDPTPVIFITAHDSPAERAEAETSGCFGYFSKTAPGSEILAAIRRATGGKPADANANAATTQRRSGDRGGDRP